MDEFLFSLPLAGVMLILVLIALSVIVWTLKNGISPMPSSGKATRIILTTIETQIDTQKTIYELGSGWGSLSFALAAKFPQCEVIAYETSPVPYLFSRIRQWITPCANLKFYHQDFFDISLKPASVVVCYLYTGAMLRLKSKFEQELPPNSIIISNTFRIPGWEPKYILEVPDLYRSNVFVYLYERNSSHINDSLPRNSLE